MDQKPLWKLRVTHNGEYRYVPEDKARKYIKRGIAEFVAFVWPVEEHQLAII